MRIPLRTVERYAESIAVAMPEGIVAPDLPASMYVKMALALGTAFNRTALHPNTTIAVARTLRIIREEAEKSL